MNDNYIDNNSTNSGENAEATAAEGAEVSPRNKKISLIIMAVVTAVYFFVMLGTEVIRVDLLGFITEEEFGWFMTVLLVNIPLIIAVMIMEFSDLLLTDSDNLQWLLLSALAMIITQTVMSGAFGVNWFVMLISSILASIVGFFASSIIIGIIAS